MRTATTSDDEEAVSYVLAAKCPEAIRGQNLLLFLHLLLFLLHIVFFPLHYLLFLLLPLPLPPPLTPLLFLQNPVEIARHEFFVWLLISYQASDKLRNSETMRQ